MPRRDGLVFLFGTAISGSWNTARWGHLGDVAGLIEAGGYRRKSRQATEAPPSCPTRACTCPATRRRPGPGRAALRRTGLGNDPARMAASHVVRLAALLPKARCAAASAPNSPFGPHWAMLR